MTKISIWLTILITCACASKNKQISPENEVKELRGRLAGFLKAIGDMNIDSIHAYTYSKLFTILPLNQSRESMERSYVFLKRKAELDSLKVDTIQPVFHIDKGSYSIAIISMAIRIPLDSTETSTTESSFDTTGKKHLPVERFPAPQSTLLATLMRNEYGIEFTSLEEANGMRTIRVRVPTIAAKDEFAKEWSFFAVTNDHETIHKLFPQKVLEKITSKD